MKKTSKRQSWQASTRLTHSPQVSLPAGNTSVVPPLYQSAKFSIDSESPLSEQFIYTRISNPTLKELELSLSEIQSREDTIVFSSGIAAITNTLLALLEQGDHVIIFRELYRPSRIFVRSVLPRYGIEHTMLKISELESMEQHIRKGKTKLIYFESPSNPHLQIADIDFITELARKHGVMTMLDGTFGGIHQHSHYPLDILAHSLTKFANGHGDVVAGSVSASKSIIEKIRAISTSLGATLDPHAAYLISRGLKTYFLRYERQSRTAADVASFLSDHPLIRKVYYPGLPHHSGHELAQRQMKDMGGILAFEIDPACGSAWDFCHRMELLQFAVSVGSTESLICPSLMFFGDDLDLVDQQEMGLNSQTIRLSIGLEHSQDIIQDLAQGLKESARE